MFFDEVRLEVEGGKGGDGAVFFHREKYVDVGGPDGGDGGDGGSVILKADENYNTLQHFMGLKHFKAENGESGFKNKMAGKAGKDLILYIPVGTLVYDEEKGEELLDLKRKGQSFLIARGGRGGYGNGHFASSVRQAPQFAELGDSGELRKVRFELRLVADVGLVGFPSAGKSTFISYVSAARPKIAAYPFTTLVPHLGVVYLSQFGGSQDQSFVIADMPGIIEGASEGKGLGDQFLKHISRAAILIFLLDPFSYENRSLSEQYKTLVNEIKKYKESLLEKDFFLVMNKIDSIPEGDRKKLASEFFKDFPNLKSKFRMVSGVSGEGMKSLLFELYNLVQKHKEKSLVIEEENEVQEYKPRILVDENSFQVEKKGEVNASRFSAPVYGSTIDPPLKPKRLLFEVTGKRIEQISRMTNTNLEGALRRIYDVFQKMGIQNALVRAGARTGDFVKVGPHVFEFHEL